ncbi:MAG: 23S rRNA (adenine(2503)-C(2))-methyltransferase RlmN [Eubacteriales bacterium]|nr:23S rRNA (adenine(2503)-C(2))-methyltransferase RlmN [Eubacteriales bacterium]
MEKKDLKSLNYDQLQQELLAMGEKTFRARQMYQWFHEKLADTPQDMSNLPQALKNRLAQEYVCTDLEILEVLTSATDGTQKFLFRLADGNVIESVLMRYHHGNSVCISSQVGCRMGCRFCASTLGGLTRNLLPGEMLDQIYKIQKYSNERVSNLVVMGTGEPLDNYENLLQFIHMLSDEHGLHISQRNITVSTCGIVPRMYDLAKEKLQITLALSLHASTQEKRTKLMPIALKYELEEVLAACRNYFEKTGRRLTFEYSLVSNVNDSQEDAKRLAALIGKINCHVNLIPVNPIKEREFVQPDRRAAEQFRAKLERAGVNATIRRTLGEDVNASCGQLRKSYMDTQEKKGQA